MFKIKFFTIILFVNVVLSCDGMSKIPTERDMLINMINAFEILSDHHHELHIMMGEEKGDFNKAYNAFSQSINNSLNIELLPVKQSLKRMKNLKKGSVDAKNLDGLVDYYQSGLSIQIEAILKGYGYKDIIDMKTILNIYDSLNIK